MAPKRVTHIHRGPPLQTHTHTQTQTRTVNCKETSVLYKARLYYTVGHKTICKQAKTKYSGTLMSAHKRRQHMRGSVCIGFCCDPIAT